MKIIKSLLKENLNNIFLKENMLTECTIAAVRLDDGVIIAKNRDRGYVAKMNIIHEIIDGVEVAYWHDVDTDWSEGINEFGIGIVNSSLLVAQDEKESDKVKQSKKINPSYDGEKIRKALSQKTMPKAIKSIISFSGNDKKDVGIKGETIVANNKNIYVIELTSSHSPIIDKIEKDTKVTVRTNHGITHKDAGYTKGVKKVSSHSRMELAQKHLQNAKKDIDVIDKMKEQYTKNKFLNPYRLKNMYHMQTVGQIMMNLKEKIMLVRMDNEMGRFLGIINRLPEGYEPKITIRVEEEKTHDDKGNKLP